MNLTGLPAPVVNGVGLKCGISSIAVLDVVEGTALAALPSMHSILARKPLFFETIDQAVQWRCECVEWMCVYCVYFFFLVLKMCF